VIGSPKPTKYYSICGYFIPSVRKSEAIWRSTLSNLCRGNGRAVKETLRQGGLLNLL
jgi:hypothetical protein